MIRNFSLWCQNALISIAAILISSCVYSQTSPNPLDRLKEAVGGSAVKSPDILKEQAEAFLVKQIGQALGQGSPLLLDQHIDYPRADEPVDFRPIKLKPTAFEDLMMPLPPGDYVIDVIAYCTQYSIHAPGQGLPYKLAPIQGKRADAISALIARGAIQGISPHTLNAEAWRIQAGIALSDWSEDDQVLIQKLIPEFVNDLEGDFLKQIERDYNKKFRILPVVPKFREMLGRIGEPGQFVFKLENARKILANKNFAAENLPDMLFEPQGDGLPRILPPEENPPSPPWFILELGVIARFTVIEGNMGQNRLEFRVTREARQEPQGAKLVTFSVPVVGLIPLARILGLGGRLLIAYSIGRAAQALILMPAGELVRMGSGAFVDLIALSDEEYEAFERWLRENQNWTDGLPECPKTVEQAKNSGVFDGGKKGSWSTHDGKFEYRQAAPVPAQRILEAGSQCLYDDKGNLIPNEGTPDRYRPSDNKWKHWQYDVGFHRYLRNKYGPVDGERRYRDLYHAPMDEAYYKRSTILKDQERWERERAEKRNNW